MLLIYLMIPMEAFYLCWNFFPDVHDSLLMPLSIISISMEVHSYTSWSILISYKFWELYNKNWNCSISYKQVCYYSYDNQQYNKRILKTL